MLQKQVYWTSLLLSALHKSLLGLLILHSDSLSFESAGVIYERAMMSLNMSVNKEVTKTSWLEAGGNPVRESGGGKRKEGIAEEQRQTFESRR